MDENNVRRRPRLDDARPRNRNKSRGFFLTGFQIVICVICLVAAFGLRQYGGKYYEKAKAYAEDALQNNITREEVSQVFHNIGKQLPDAAEIFSSGISSSSGQTASRQATSEDANTSSASSEGSPESIPSGGESVSEPSSVETKDGVNTLNCSTKTAKLASVSGSSFRTSQLPPATASLAPYKVTIKPIKPVEGRITSAYGYRIHPITGKYSFHTGMDIAAARGTPVLAAYGGTVEEAGSSQIYGNCILLDNGGGIKTFYADCDTIKVKKGETVKAGQTIATVGSTGLSTGNHLHFEIRVNSIYHNPQWVI